MKYTDTLDSGIELIEGNWKVKCPQCKNYCDVGFSDFFEEKEDWWFASCENCEINMDWWTNRDSSNEHNVLL